MYIFFLNFNILILISHNFFEPKSELRLGNFTNGVQNICLLALLALLSLKIFVHIFYFIFYLFFFQNIY